jgi:hypothetical protein
MGGEDESGNKHSNLVKAQRTFRWLLVGSYVQWFAMMLSITSEYGVWMRVYGDDFAAQARLLSALASAGSVIGFCLNPLLAALADGRGRKVRRQLPAQPTSKLTVECALGGPVARRGRRMRQGGCHLCLPRGACDGRLEPVDATHHWLLGDLEPLRSQRPLRSIRAAAQCCTRAADSCAKVTSLCYVTRAAAPLILEAQVLSGGWRVRLTHRHAFACVQHLRSGVPARWKLPHKSLASLAFRHPGIAMAGQHRTCGFAPGDGAQVPAHYGRQRRRLEGEPANSAATLRVRALSAWASAPAASLRACPQ